MAELSLVGLSHHGASLEVRERVALDPDDEGEAVCLSTCNRTELYVAGPGSEERAAGVLSDVDGALYRRADNEAARHLFRVAAGLDSRVRGETEILPRDERTGYWGRQEEDTAASLLPLTRPGLTGMFLPAGRMEPTARGTEVVPGTSSRPPIGTYNAISRRVRVVSYQACRAFSSFLW